MENKDQRLEIRIPQQQLTDIDDIIASVDSGFKPTRSDVVRSFIAQGIDRHLGRGSRVEESLPLGQRLALFFQICQQQNLQYAQVSKRPPVLNTRHSGINTNITAEALVRQVYLQRMFWFFELDRSSLTMINGQLASDEVISLMDPQPNRAVCDEVQALAQILEMYSQIQTVLKKAEEQSSYTDVQEKLTLIKHYVSRCRIPVKFAGFPESWVCQNQIAALMLWIEEGKAGDYMCTGYGGRISHCQNDDPDADQKYAMMVKVHKDIVGERGQLDLECLITMVQDRRLDFSTPA